VSGGGTLYMKWGAGRNSATRTQQREQVEKHTPTFNFTILFLTNLNLLLRPQIKFIFIPQKTLKKKAKIL
jgi:hypothetical protein